MDMIPAHTQTTTLHIVECYPDHTPRADDPHYKYFNQAHDRLKKLGKLVCWVGNKDCAGAIELHHAICEFSLSNGVDVTKFAELYPEFGVVDDETFLRFVEEEGNLTPLCMAHHRGIYGVHSLPYPNWLPQRFYKSTLPAPAHLIVGGK
jgi:hypothetical protein